MTTSCSGTALRKKVVFLENPVTEVWLRPYTSRCEAERIFYQPQDYKRFRTEAKSRRIEEDILELDDLEVNFSLSTAFVSILLALVFLFACALGMIERAYVGRQRTSSLSPRWAQKSCAVQRDGLSHFQVYRLN